MNFGYALGYTAEAELSEQFSSNNSAIDISQLSWNSTKGFAMCNPDFDIFAVSFLCVYGQVLGGYMMFERVNHGSNAIEDGFTP